MISHSQNLRAAGVLRLLVARAARAGVSAIPIVGSALEHMTFGIKESLDTKALEERLTALAAEVKLNNDRLDAAEIGRSIEAAPELANLQTLLTSMPAFRYQMAEDSLLETMDRLPPWSDSNAVPETNAREILDALVKADEELRQHTLLLRGPARAWMEDLRAHDDIGQFIEIVHQLADELDFLSAGKGFRCVDASTVSSFVRPHGGQRFDIASTCAAYLFSQPGIIETFAPAALGDIQSTLRNALHDLRETKAFRERDSEIFGRAERLQTFIKLAGDWRPDKFASIETQGLHELEERYLRLLADTADRRSLAGAEWSVARTLAIVDQFNRLTPSTPACLVSTRRRLYGLSGCRFVRSPYGAAWGAFVSAGSPEHKKVWEHTASFIEASRELSATDTPRPPVKIEVAIDGFWEAVRPFHNTLADLLDAQRSDLIDAFTDWIAELGAGSEAFARLRRSMY